MKKIQLSVLRSDAKVGTTENKKGLSEVLPKGSFVIIKPDGTDARSDMSIGTLREIWAKHEKVSVEDYREAGTLNPVVQIKDNGAVGTLKDKLAQGLGLPLKSVQLRMPDNTPIKSGMHYSTFIDLWKKANSQ